MSSIPLDERTQKLVSALQLQCLHPGIGALRQLSCMFRRMDLDYSKKICFEEFVLGLRSYNLKFSDEDIELLFSALDINDDGQIDFREFLELLIPPMNEVRTNVINEAFDKLDINGDGTIQMDELKIVYAANARKHPKYLSGEWTEEQTLRYFLDGLDTPGDPDGEVTREEFMNYYARVSATVDDDCYFDMVVRSLYGLPAVRAKAKR
ncbi:unnamed protein product [Candidula unifasciata]|uniref:EF-hand domain-containing protein n=1 Tax=Candidula unifasciata TaxID=100452 RepID=A0A8S3YGA0_9EUPU|nr:unnamed protein product [Candidula unifasciata]